MVTMTYQTGMRNISAGAVLAAQYFPGEVMFPVMMGTLFQQVLADNIPYLVVLHICSQKMLHRNRSMLPLITLKLWAKHLLQLKMPLQA